MGVRFRRSVKFGPEARTGSSGKGNAYGNSGIPGAEISYRMAPPGGSLSRRSSGMVSRSTSSGSSVSRAVQDWRTYTGRPNPGVELYLNELGEIGFLDELGVEIYDPYLVEIIKRTPQYRAQLLLIKEHQRATVAKLVERSERHNLSFVQAHLHSPKVFDRDRYERRLADLKPECYIPQTYSIPAPTPAAIQTELSVEAERNVKGMPWNVRKLREQYFNERYQDRYNEAIAGWQSAKAAFDNAELAKAAQLNLRYIEEYDRKKLMYENALAGGLGYIEDAAEQWISSVKLPVDIATQYEYRPDERCMMVDLDLPEIEDLPTEVAVQMANGSMKVKDKTQKALRSEYAECVFGLAIFVAANLFKISPEMETVVLSGYTQRRDKVGNLVDDYILSIRFVRDAFYGVDFKSIDPEGFCMGFENRCNVTTTKVFKAIVPYE